MSEVLQLLDRGYTMIWRERRLEARALAFIRMHGRGRESGVPTEMRYAQLFTFDGLRPVRMVLYFDLDEARRAAGLA